MLDDQLLISELAERAGVSVRTIRFYISEGLLPAPQAHGRYSLYDEEYLTRIQVIKLLKNAYLPLKEIKRTVESLSKEDIEIMLQKLNELPSSPQVSTPVSSPAPAPATAPKNSGPFPGDTGAPPARPQIKDGGLPEALDYIARVLKSQASPSAQSPTDAGTVFTMLAPASPPARPHLRARASLPEAGAAAPATPSQAAAPEEIESSWRRYTIQPGVELLVSEQVYHQAAPSIHSIVAQIKQLFSTHSSGGQNV